MALTKADKDELKQILSDTKPTDCSDDIQAIISVQATQTEQLANIMTFMKDIKLTVYGNGKPGLTTIVSGLVSAMGILKWIGIALGGSVIAFIWAIITHSVEIVH